MVSFGGFPGQRGPVRVPVADTPPEVRISPDYTLVAIRNGPDAYYAWRVSNGAYYCDEHVADWHPMVRLDVIPLEERRYYGEVSPDA